MKTIKLFILLIGYLLCENVNAQTVSANPDSWTAYNRAVNFSGEIIHLNAQEGDGVLWLNDFNFSNGVIELDIKGENTPGRSFVGLAFHGQNNDEFDAVYFRPFNFKNPSRNAHSIQYVSMPKNDWAILRNAFPGKYENTINPVPDPVEDWFHTKINISYPNVKVYVNGSDEATLEIEQISVWKQGKVGLWVGNGSEGWFKNITIIKE